ncbi:hypothetical protein BB559_000390 [Furculomyces boomerangus]|uniref:ATPase inhibitor, mitochondrial n=2 Tax=Harpellales TaxID=61421 RepID=A0A2T9Z5E1_9FUNG|nr:hypothetical protein BB559_000390 [Furculomyces boomerangus]PVZ99204.1 hypothetical protein BB558_004765 [Smittium angustum]
MVLSTNKCKPRKSITRSAAFRPLRQFQSTRSYMDGKLSEREKAAEDMYIRQREMEKYKALHERMEKAEKEMQEIKSQLKEFNNGANKKQ